MSGGSFSSASFYNQQIAFAPRLAARATDPVTSHEAAGRAKEFAASQCAKVLDALRRAGGKAGAEQIAWIAGMEPYTARKRLADCEKAGQAAPTDEKSMTRSGRRERVWRLVA